MFLLVVLKCMFVIVAFVLTYAQTQQSCHLWIFSLKKLDGSKPLVSYVYKPDSTPH